MPIFNNTPSKRSSGPIAALFNKEEVIQEILETKNEKCPGWNFCRLLKDESYSSINCDFLAIYTDVINKEVRLTSNPFSDYKRVVESVYQIVRQVNITDQEPLFEEKVIYKNITAKSAKELFIKLKREQE